MPYQSLNPLTGQLIREFEEHNDQAVQKTLNRAEDTYAGWREVTFAERASRMHAAARQLRQNKDRYAQLMTDEMGKLKREAVAEVEKCAMTCDYYAKHAADFLADEPLSVENGEAYLTYEPIGAVLAVMPWNFPFWQAIRFAAPNLMAGNVGLLKHAPNVPQCALALEEVFREAGFPEGTFQNLFISNEQVATLLEDPRVRAATLTGSERAGSAVAQKSGEQLKKTVLELGGSDPFIVLPDADLDQAVAAAVQSRMLNCGQSCIAAKRFIVLREVADAFTDALVERMGKLQQGDPNDSTTDYGPMAREDLANELLRQVRKTVTQGAKVLLGADRPDREGAFFNATVLTDVPKGSPAYAQELFGPVAAVFAVADEDEAVRLANDSPYGLGGSVWTQDVEKGKALAQRIDSGAVYVNKMMASHPAVPFGGVKRSGYGRELSYLGIREFTNQKTVWVG
jgi:succinate-semialdehyde dehydrogenase/glutarate-semialdehyde dehydrogenase